MATRQQYQSLGVTHDVHEWVKALSHVYGTSMGDLIKDFLQYSNPAPFMIQAYMRKVCTKYQYEGVYDIDTLALHTYKALRFGGSNVMAQAPDEYRLLAQEVVNTL